MMVVIEAINEPTLAQTEVSGYSVRFHKYFRACKTPSFLSLLVLVSRYIEIHSFKLQKYRDLGNGDVPCQHGWSQNPQQRDVPHIFALTPTDRRSPK